MVFKKGGGAGERFNLAEIEPGDEAEVEAFEALDADTAEWLRAVGIAEGSRVAVLRRAAFGGPLHVRTGAGGEFAIHRSLARAIRVRVIDRAERAS